MNKNLEEKPRTDDIDIIEIFNLIGRAIKSVFDFILNIFQQLFMLLILLALFIKRNIIILTIAVVVGFVVGFISDMFQKTFFTSTMVVEPNFDTSTQLIDNIKLYAQLARSRDSIVLGQMLEISPSDASKIISIGLEAKNTKNTRLKLFDEFVKEADSTTLKNITFEEFEQNLSTGDYEQYFIVLDSKDKSVFKKVEKSILNIPLTPYIQSLKNTELDNLNTQILKLNSSLNKIDSLRNDYKKIMLDTDEKAKRPAGTGTTFYMGTENIRTTNELQLFEIERNYNKIIEDLSLEKAQKQNYINVISGFQEIGIRMKNQNKLIYAAIALGLAMLFLILKEFNKFLVTQERKLKENV